jgi:hypothetical protein
VHGRLIGLSQNKLLQQAANYWCHIDRCLDFDDQVLDEQVIAAAVSHN